MIWKRMQRRIGNKYIDIRVRTHRFLRIGIKVDYGMYDSIFGDGEKITYVYLEVYLGFASGYIHVNWAKR